MTPLVPVKIEAGWKFQRRNPSSAPARAKQRTAISGWPTCGRQADQAERRRRR